MKMLTKPEIAKLIFSEVDTTKEVMVQFFHSTFFNIESEDYIKDYLDFEEELNKVLIECEDWGIKDTFLANTEFTTLKIPKKVLKQMEEDYLETQEFIRKVIEEINSQD